jgi:hypothetical protein
MKMRKGILWGLIITLVYTWHVVWWVILAPGMPERVVSARPAALRYLAVQPGAEDQAEDLWTPTLFAYPFKAGFSKPLLKKDAGAVPPLRMIRDLSVALARPIPSDPNGITVKTPTLLPEVEARLADFAFSPNAVEHKLDESLPPLVLSRRLSPPEATLRERPLPETLAAVTNLPWQAQCTVAFQANGFVERTYIELNLDNPVVRTQLLAWAQGLRLTQPQAGVKALFTVSHLVPYQEPVPVPEATSDGVEGLE